MKVKYECCYHHEKWLVMCHLPLPCEKQTAGPRDAASTVSCGVGFSLDVGRALTSLPHGSVIRATFSPRSVDPFLSHLQVWKLFKGTFLVCFGNAHKTGASR